MVLTVPPFHTKPNNSYLFLQVGRPPDAAFDDQCVFSACRLVEVYNFTGSDKGTPEDGGGDGGVDWGGDGGSDGGGGENGGGGGT